MVRRSTLDVSGLRRALRAVRLVALLFAAAFLLAVAALAYARYIEPRWLRVNKIRLSKAPRVRLVHISDLHHKGDATFLRRVVATINRLPGDLVCFTGDLVEDGAYMEEALAILGGLNKPLYGIAGNHDQWARLPRAALERGFARTGGAWLSGTSAWVALPSVELYTGESLARGLDAGDGGAVRVLLVHRPYEAQRARGMDLVLAGHCHGGQIRLPFVGGAVLDGDCARFDRGLFQADGGPLHVSAGLGTYYLPLRFLCRPEVAVIEL